MLSALLFFVLVPGVLVTLPKNGGKYKVAAVHAVIFGIVFYFTRKLVAMGTESFKEGAKNCPKDAKCGKAYACNKLNDGRPCGKIESCGKNQSYVSGCGTCQYAGQGNNGPAYTCQ